jgi:nitroreductase
MSLKKHFVVFPKLVASYFYDAWRFGRAAHLNGPFKNRASARAHLLRLSHSLEKGMALPKPRKGFGKDLTKTVLADLNRYIQLYGADQTSLTILDIVDETLLFHARHGVAWPEISTLLEQLREPHGGIKRVEGREVGTVRINITEVREALPRNAEKFFNLRRSVRQFAAEPVTHEEIERAVRMAQRAPSVCNRQGAKVYAYTETAERSLVLSFQDGNEGFGNEASVVFVVTSDMSIFYKNGERNQAFVDGGLFAMALVFALHALGLGSCMLNWSKSPRQDVSLRRALGIPESEVIVTLLVAGRLLPEFSVAASPRRSLGEVLKWGLGESGP